MLGRMLSQSAISEQKVKPVRTGEARGAGSLEISAFGSRLAGRWEAALPSHSGISDDEGGETDGHGRAGRRGHRKSRNVWPMVSDCLADRFYARAALPWGCYAHQLYTESQAYDLVCFALTALTSEAHGQSAGATSIKEPMDHRLITLTIRIKLGWNRKEREIHHSGQKEARVVRKMNIHRHNTSKVIRQHDDGHDHFNLRLSAGCSAFSDVISTPAPRHQHNLGMARKQLFQWHMWVLKRGEDWVHCNPGLLHLHPGRPLMTD